MFNNKYVPKKREVDKRTFHYFIWVGTLVSDPFPLMTFMYILNNCFKLEKISVIHIFLHSIDTLFFMITTRQRSYGKVLFSPMFVCPHGRGYLW